MEQNRIERIAKRSRNKYILEFLNHDSIEVDLELIVQLGLVKGMELSSLEIDELYDTKERNIVYNHSLHLLGIKPRTKKELLRKLSEKKYDEKWINWSITKLENEGYINHKEYAIQFALESVKYKKKGTKWIAYELSNKGIEKEYIQNAINELDADIEIDSIEEAINKKWHTYQTKYDRRTAKYKLISYLKGRGFSNHAINQALSTIDLVYDNND
jgi:regulatory protein